MDLLKCIDAGASSDAGRPGAGSKMGLCRAFLILESAGRTVP